MDLLGVFTPTLKKKPYKVRGKSQAASIPSPGKEARMSYTCTGYKRSRKGDIESKELEIINMEDKDKKVVDK